MSNNAAIVTLMLAGLVSTTATAGVLAWKDHPWMALCVFLVGVLSTVDSIEIRKGGTDRE